MRARQHRSHELAPELPETTKKEMAPAVVETEALGRLFLIYSEEKVTKAVPIKSLQKLLQRNGIDPTGIEQGPDARNKRELRKEVELRLSRCMATLYGRNMS